MYLLFLEQDELYRVQLLPFEPVALARMLRTTDRCRSSHKGPRASNCAAVPPRRDADATNRTAPLDGDNDGERIYTSMICVLRLPSPPSDETRIRRPSELLCGSTLNRVATP